MTNKELTNILKAMLYASELDPSFADDYYGAFTPENMSRFFNGLVGYFSIKPDSYIFYYNNINYMDSPSETIKYFIACKGLLLGGDE